MSDDGVLIICSLDVYGPFDGGVGLAVTYGPLSNGGVGPADSILGVCAPLSNGGVGPIVVCILRACALISDVELVAIYILGACAPIGDDGPTTICILGACAPISDVGLAICIILAYTPLSSGGVRPDVYILITYVKCLRQLWSWIGCWHPRSLCSHERLKSNGSEIT